VTTTPASPAKASPFASLFAPWLVRGGLAILLFVGWELLLGRDLFVRSAIDLVARLAGCLAITTLLLDLVERFAVRDIFAALPVMGSSSLLYFILFDTRVTTDLFLTLASRALGAYTLFGLLMLFSLLWLAQMGGWRFLLALIPFGIISGIWLRWMPYEPTPGEDGALILLISLLLWLSGAQLARYGGRSTQTRLRLERSELFGVLGLLIFGVSAQTSVRLPDGVSLVITVTLVALCVVMLWFQRRSKGATYAEALVHWHSGVQHLATPPPLRLLAWALVMAGSALAGAALPRGEAASDPVAIFGTLFTAFGLVWLPTVALVYGWRAIRRDVRAMRL
jgi:hypothetical protein